MKVGIRILAVYILLIAGASLLEAENRSVDSASVLKNHREFLNFNLFDGSRGMVLSSSMSHRISKAESNPFTRRMQNRYIERHLGFIVVEGEIIGLNTEISHGLEVRVFACAVCHSGKAAGLFIPGLGNKGFDVFEGGRQLGNYLDRQRVEDPTSDASRNFASIVGDVDKANRVRGIVNDVLVWQAIDPGDHPWSSYPAFVKIPAAWGFEAKTRAGYFCDGLGRGLGWYGAVPWAAGHPPAALRGQIGELRRIEEIFLNFEPPAYPFSVSTPLVERGRQVFRENCAGCHGEYRRDERGKSLFEVPKWIPLEKVGTDPARLQFPEGFLEAIDTNPIRDILQRNVRGPGYLAPRLEGIWSRFPYLHNGSVPSLEALLTEPDKRPRVFSVKDAGERHRFDEKVLGLRAPPRASLQEQVLKAAASRGDRNIYDTSRVGHSSEGHPFATRLPAEEKRALIEYLKTL